MLDDNLAVVIWLHSSLRDQWLLFVDWSMLIGIESSVVNVCMMVVVVVLASQLMTVTGRVLRVAVESVGSFEGRVCLVHRPVGVLVAEGSVAVQHVALLTGTVIRTCCYDIRVAARSKES